MDTPLEFGLDTFGDVTVDADGKRLSSAEVIRNVIDEAVLATRSASTRSGWASTIATTSQ